MGGETGFSGSGGLSIAFSSDEVGSGGAGRAPGAGGVSATGMERSGGGGVMGDGGWSEDCEPSRKSLLRRSRNGLSTPSWVIKPFIPSSLAASSVAARIFWLEINFVSEFSGVADSASSGLLMNTLSGPDSSGVAVSTRFTVSGIVSTAAGLKRLAFRCFPDVKPSVTAIAQTRIKSSAALTTAANPIAVPSCWRSAVIPEESGRKRKAAQPQDGCAASGKNEPADQFGWNHRVPPLKGSTWMVI